MSSKLSFLVLYCSLSFALCEESSSSEWQDGPLLFPYRHNSGAGNRDALEIQDAHLEKFDSPKGILKWKTLKVNQTQWALGLRGSSFVLSEIKRMHNNTYSVRNTVVEVSQNITDAWIFQVTPTLVVLSIAFEVPGTFLQKGSWYKITSAEPKEIYSWPSLEPTVYFTAFQYDDNIGVALIRHLDEKSSLEVYRVSFVNDIPQVSLLSNTMLSSMPTSIVTTLEVQDLYLSLVIPSSGSVEVYHLTRFCPQQLPGDLSKHQTIPAEDVHEAKGFSVAGRNYLAVDGANASIYKFNRNGAIVKAEINRDLGFVFEWLALPVATYRQDVLLLAKIEGGAVLFTWGGVHEGFLEKEFPPCALNRSESYSVSDCEDLLLDESWAGAGVMGIGDAPFFLLPTSSGDSILVHFMTLLHPVLNPDLESISINKRANQLYDRWQSIWEDFRLGSYANRSEIGDFQVDKGISALTLEKTEERVRETLEILRIANSTFGLSALDPKKDKCYSITANISEKNLVQEDLWYFSGELELQVSVLPPEGTDLFYNDGLTSLVGHISPEECSTEPEATSPPLLKEMDNYPKYPIQHDYYAKNDQPTASLIDYAKKRLNFK